MTDTNTYQAQANELSQKLWAIANDLRGQMDASEFKNYILGVIFYRYLSERTEMYMIDLLKNDDGITYEEAFADEEYRPVVEEWSLSKLGYVIKPENLFRNLIRKITKFENDADKFSVEDFEKAINDLVGSTMGHESNKAFDGLFNDMRLQDSRLGETVADRTEMIGRVMVRVSDIDFDLQDSQFDVLGTAYMILIGLFASDAGKKGGEFFTPAGPSKLCATLAALGLDEAKTVGDCTCGSASMLLEVQKHLTTGKVGHFYGQELNATTYNLSRMNMIMHGIDWQNFDIYKGDTLKDDKYGDIKMTVQVCNPPYSLKWSADKQFEDDPIKSEVKKRIWRNVQRRCEGKSDTLVHIELWHSLAAAVVILLVIGGLLFLSGNDDMGVEKTIKIIAEKNQLYVLPDSTKVWMQPGSSIRYAKTFARDRKVWLEGNSLFEVRKHQGNTFQVYINDAFIEVKGTCFLVKQEDAHRSEITLFEGKIEFNVPSTRQKTVMRPLQKLIYNSVDSQTQIDNIANISWENGRYNFKDVPLAQLIQIVSQMYHTDILLQGVRKDESSFSGSIHYTEPLDKVLNKICFSLNLNIRQTDDRIVLY